MEGKEGNLFLGLDSSTQGLKAVVVCETDLAPVFEVAVNFDSELPEYGTTGGALHHKGTISVHWA